MRSDVFYSDLPFVCQGYVVRFIDGPWRCRGLGAIVVLFVAARRFERCSGSGPSRGGGCSVSATTKRATPAPPAQDPT